MTDPTPRPSRPASGRRPRAPDVEARILRAATALFARDGYASVTVPAVAAAARVGLNSLYDRYPSKTALGNAVFRRSKRAWAEATLDDWPAEAPPAEQFATYWSRLSAFAARERDMALYNERRPLGHDLDAESDALHAALQRRAGAILRGWAGPGGLAPEVMEALIHGTFRRLLELDVSPRRRAALIRQAGPAVWAALTRARRP